MRAIKLVFADLLKADSPLRRIQKSIFFFGFFKNNRS